MSTTTFVQASICIMLVFRFFFAHVTTTGATEFVVQSGFDVNDLEPGNGLCVAYLTVNPPFVIPYCTLRAAIEETNLLPGPDTIQLPSGTFTLGIEGLNEDDALTGDLDITDSLNIHGKGIAKTFINGNNLDRVFDIVSPDITVVFTDLTILNGTLPPFLKDSNKGGGGIRNRGNIILRNVVVKDNLAKGSASRDVGGGLHNLSSCTLEDTTISGNQASSGGGIYNSQNAFLKIIASTIHDNEALSGGGIANNGQLRLVNSTLSGNRSSASSGGGLYNNSDVEIQQSTIAFNTSLGLGGGLKNEGQLQLINTIIANNAQTNCLLSQPILSLGRNIDDGNSCSLNATTDFVHTDPRLDQLQSHGGPTLTHGLYIGSPAVDSGIDLSYLGITKDQRGVKRPMGDAFDIGAFETKKRAVTPFILPLLCCDS